jgi:hypothetical protein
MRAKVLIILLALAAILPSPVAAQQRDQPIGRTPPWPSTIVTKDQFEALGPDAMIEANGQRLTKQLFLQQNAAAAAAMAKRIPELKAEAKARFEARRKACLDAQQAKLDDARKKTLALANLFLDQAKAGRPANYDDLFQQGIALLHRAEANPPPSEAAEIEKQERELLKVLDPEAAKEPAN